MTVAPRGPFPLQQGRDVQLTIDLDTRENAQVPSDAVAAHLRAVLASVRNRGGTAVLAPRNGYDGSGFALRSLGVPPTGAPSPVLKLRAGSSR